MKAQTTKFSLHQVNLNLIPVRESIYFWVVEQAVVTISPREPLAAHSQIFIFDKMFFMGVLSMLLVLQVSVYCTQDD